MDRPHRVPASSSSAWAKSPAAETRSSSVRLDPRCLGGVSRARDHLAQAHQDLQLVQQHPDPAERGTVRMPAQAALEDLQRLSVVASRVTLPGRDLQHPSQSGGTLDRGPLVAAGLRGVRGIRGLVEAQPVAADIHDGEPDGGALLAARPQEPRDTRRGHASQCRRRPAAKAAYRLSASGTTTITLPTEVAGSKPSTPIRWIAGQVRSR